ncbi:MAG: P-loop NTPase [Clostridia bacterium]|nr:P-loop NTPase [Clostridia bacterium]
MAVTVLCIGGGAGLATALEESPDITLAGQVPDVESYHRLADLVRPDVVVLSALVLGAESPASACARIAATSPHPHVVFLDTGSRPAADEPRCLRVFKPPYSHREVADFVVRAGRPARPVAHTRKGSPGARGESGRPTSPSQGHTGRLRPSDRGGTWPQATDNGAASERDLAWSLREETGTPTPPAPRLRPRRYPPPKGDGQREYRPWPRVRALEPAPPRSRTRVAPPAPAEAPGRDLPVLQPQSISLYSPKGGVGRTFLAVNLAVYLARSRQRVALVDLHLTAPGVGVHLDLADAPTSLIDVLPHASELNRELAARFLVRHRRSGCDVILGPPRPELASIVSAEAVGALLRWLRRAYDFLVLDLPGEPGNDVVLKALEESTQVVLVTTPDAVSLRWTRWAMEVLPRLSLQADGQFHAVLNRVARDGPVSLEESRRLLGTTPLAVVPDDPSFVQKAIFRGEPVVVSDPDHPVSRAIGRLAEHFYPFGGPVTTGGWRSTWYRLTNTLRRR